MSTPIIGNVIGIRQAVLTLSGSTSTTAADFTFSLPGIRPGDAVIMTCPSSVTASAINVYNARCVTDDVLTITARASTGTPSLSGSWTVTVLRAEGQASQFNNVFM